GESSVPGGLSMKSLRSLPAVKASPAPCQSTTRTSSLAAASARISPSRVYIAEVIAFFLSGRFSSTRRIPLLNSVIMSVIVCFFFLVFRASGSALRRIWDGAAFAKAGDALVVESKLVEDFLGMFSEKGPAARGRLLDAVHLDWIA